jgi:hypothetical protein
MLHRLTGRFKGIWKLGWESAVVWADGSATDYAAGPASLAQGAPATSSYEQACQAAVANLGDFHGRKLVLYLPGRLKAGKPVILQSGKAKIGSGTGTSFVPVVKRKPGTASVPTPVVQGAARSMAVLYVLDGGEPASFSGSWSTLGPTNGEIVGWPSYGSAHSTFIDGVKHELGSSIAFADMRRDSRGYYDLDLTPQPGYSIDPHQPLSVKIKVRGSFRTVSQADGIGKDLPIEVSQR